MTRAFYTVGHSTRSVDELVALLKTGNIGHVVDVRAMPRSRTNPQFNGDALPDSLARYGMGYTHCVALAAFASAQTQLMMRSTATGKTAVFTTTQTMHYRAHLARRWMH